MNQEELNLVVELHRKWVRSEEGGKRAVLIRAVLTGMDLTRAVLTYANLTRAVLTGTDLTRADLTGAVLTDANLTGADLTGANLSCAYLTRAVLNCADLSCANLRGAYLSEANLSGVKLSWHSQTLLSEILWRVAKTEDQQMLAAFVGRKTDWCWDHWEKYPHPAREWAISELAKWGQEGDDAPEFIRNKR